MSKILPLLLMVIPTVCNAETFYGKIENISAYDKGGMACVTNQAYNDDFKQIADSVSQDKTDNGAALKLLQFFQDEKHGSCYHVQNDGNFSIKLPDQGAQYILIVTLSTTHHVFWEYLIYHGESPETKVFNAPSF